jgi:hypothetical protein
MNLESHFLNRGSKVMQLDLDFTTRQHHGFENNRESEEIYVEQMPRLHNNARIILKCLQEGQRLTGTDCQNGIRTKDGETAKMSEYRKRFSEIIRSGVDVKTERLSNGCKVWFL